MQPPAPPQSSLVYRNGAPRHPARHTTPCHALPRHHTLGHCKIASAVTAPLPAFWQRRQAQQLLRGAVLLCHCLLMLAAARGGLVTDSPRLHARPAARPLAAEQATCHAAVGHNPHDTSLCKSRAAHSARLHACCARAQPSTTRILPPGPASAQLEASACKQCLCWPFNACTMHTYAIKHIHTHARSL